MRNAFISGLFIFCFASVVSAQSARDTLPINIKVTEVATDDSSAMFTVNIDLTWHDIDRFFFEDEEGGIVFVKEVADLSGEHNYVCRVGGLKENREYKWKIAVHSRSNMVLKRITVTFKTDKRKK